LDARAGAIQAAINLEVQGYDVDYINIKIEGLNGQLPNLDLHNLVQKLSSNQGISAAYKLKSSSIRRGPSHMTKLMNMMSMVLTQTTGVPTGNHGLFHKYGIEALTLECVKKASTNYQRTRNGINALIRIVEGICRSLNNLLERFHQSFFFYIMVSHDRFVSIGDYMISLGLMVGPLFIKAFLLWLSFKRDGDDKKDDGQTERNSADGAVNYLRVGVMILVAHIIGILMAYLPLNSYLDGYFHSIGVPTEKGLFYIIVAISTFSMFIPLASSLNENEAEVCAYFLN
jgi:glycosylphosphatidylinositol transamidase